MKIIYMTRQIEKLHILYVKLHILHLKCLIQNSYKIIIYLITLKSLGSVRFSCVLKKFLMLIKAVSI